MPSLLFSDSDILEIRTLYPYLDIAPLSPQQERLVIGLVRGLTAPAAARMAGMSVREAETWLLTAEADAIVGHYRDQTREGIQFDRDRMSMMLFDAHDVAATAGERVSAIRELGLIHNIYPQKTGTTVNVTNNTQNNNVTVTNQKRLERMSDAELLQLAELPSLEPVANARVPQVIEHDPVRQKPDSN